MIGITYIVISMFILSFLLGSIITKFIDFNENEIFFVFPIGLVVLLGLLQLIYYPVEIFELKTNYLIYGTLIVFILIILISLVYYKRIIEAFRGILKKWKYFLLGIILFAISIYILQFIRIDIRINDGQFYFNFIKIKSQMDYLVYDNLMYKYQGFYDLCVVIVRLYQKMVNQGLTENILVIGIISNTMGFILSWFLTSTIIAFMAKFKNWKSIILGLILFIYYITSNWFSEWFFCGNSFRKITIAIILLLLLKYMKKQNKFLLLTITLSIVSLISQTSTGFFFSVFIIYVLLFYYAYCNEEGYISKLLVLGVGPAIFMVLYMPITKYLIIPLYILFILLTIIKKENMIERIWNKIYLPVLFIIPFLFGVISRLPFYETPDFLINAVRHPLLFRYGVENELVDDLLVFNFSSMTYILWTLFSIFAWGCIGYFFYKKIKDNDKREKFLPFYIFIILLTFFNPWVINFVSKYFTGLVYFRIYDLFFNLTTIFAIFMFIVNQIKSKLLSSIFLFIVFILFCFHNNTNNLFNHLELNDQDYSKLYHTNMLEIELIDKLSNEYLINDEEPIVIAQQIYSPFVLTNEDIDFVVPNFYDFESANKEENEFQKIFFKNMPGVDKVEGDYMQVCELSQKREVDYFIIDAQYNGDLENGIGYCGEKLFEMGNYRVFKAHYDWLEWSMK